MTNKEALEKIYRDGVFIKEDSVKGYVIDSKRTTEYFSKYCNIIKQDLDRLEELETRIKNTIKHLENSREIAKSLGGDSLAFAFARKIALLKEVLEDVKD